MKMQKKILNFPTTRIVPDELRSDRPPRAARKKNEGPGETREDFPYDPVLTFFSQAGPRSPRRK